MLACSLVHEGVENLTLSRIQVIQNPFESFPDDVTIEQCRQCVDPACVKACPVDALKANAEYGNVRMVDRTKCIGCGDHTPDFYLNVQPRDMSLEVISIIRSGRVLVAIRPALEFTIGITVFHPLDAKTIRYLIGMARHPHPSHGVNMRENNWEYALDMAAPKASSFYAFSRGESYLSYWGKGLGVSHNGKVDLDLKKYHNKKQLMPNIVAAQIGTYYERME